MIFIPLLNRLRKPIMAKVVIAWLRKLSENPTMRGACSSITEESRFSKYEKNTFSSGCSEERTRSALHTGERVSCWKLLRLTCVENA